MRRIRFFLLFLQAVLLSQCYSLYKVQIQDCGAEITCEDGCEPQEVILSSNSEEPTPLLIFLPNASPTEAGLMLGGPCYIPFIPVPIYSSGVSSMIVQPYPPFGPDPVSEITFTMAWDGEPTKSASAGGTQNQEKLSGPRLIWNNELGWEPSPLALQDGEATIKQIDIRYESGATETLKNVRIAVTHTAFGFHVEILKGFTPGDTIHRSSFPPRCQ